MAVNVVFLSQIAIYGLAFALRVALARGLGDEGLGDYQLFYLAVLITGGFANLGVGLGNVYFLNKGERSYRTLLSGTLFVLLTTSLLTWLGVGGYGLFVEPDLLVSGDAYWLYAAALPAIVGYTLLTSFLHGSSRFLALSAVAIAQGVFNLAALATLSLAGELDVFGALAAWAGSFLLADILALVLIGGREIDLAGIARPSWQALRQQIKYGSQGQVANLATFFNYRLDQFLVAAFDSRAGVGHYTVAVGLAESVWWISSAVAMVLLPRLTQMEKERAEEMTPLVCRNTVLVSILAAAGIMATSPVLIRVLFGREFTEATVPLLLLMPGIIAASATRVLGSYLFSQGKIIYSTYATFIALGGTVALDLALIPWLGVPGAAIASSIAYSISLFAVLHWYRKVSGRGIAEALVFRPSDRQFYLRFLQKLRVRATPAQKKAT